MRNILYAIWLFLIQLPLLIVPGAMAQNAASALSGSCIPHTQEQGPWDCKVAKVVNLECLESKVILYDDAWKLVRNSDEAVILLKSVYSRLNDPLKFSQWLACQGFKANMGPAVIVPNFRNYESIVYNFSYSTKSPPFPVSWLEKLFGAYGADIVIFLDNFGQIKEIKQGYSFE